MDGRIGRNHICPLPESDDRVTWLKGQMIPTLSLNYSNINQITYALPLDVCIQMLFYRRDLFEDELVKREFLSCTGDGWNRLSPSTNLTRLPHFLPDLKMKNPAPVMEPPPPMGGPFWHPAIFCLGFGLWKPLFLIKTEGSIFRRLI